VNRTVVWTVLSGVTVYVLGQAALKFAIGPDRSMRATFADRSCVGRGRPDHRKSRRSTGRRDSPIIAKHESPFGRPERAPPNGPLPRRHAPRVFLTGHGPRSRCGPRPGWLFQQPVARLWKGLQGQQQVHRAHLRRYLATGQRWPSEAELGTTPARGRGRGAPDGPGRVPSVGAGGESGRVPGACGSRVAPGM